MTRFCMLLMVLTLGNLSLSANTLFSDTFAGNTLNPAYTVLHQNSSLYTVNNGLFTATQNGDLFGETNNYVNLFTVANTSTSGAFTATLGYQNFNPSTDFEQVDLVAYTDDDNYVRLGYGYIDGLSVQPLVEVGGDDSYAQYSEMASSGYLQMTQIGDQYTFAFSTDDVNFTTIGPALTYDGTIESIGFMAINGASPIEDNAPLEITSFDLTDASNSVPEPATLTLFALAAAVRIAIRKIARA